jgi:hypothetical protein
MPLPLKIVDSRLYIAASDPGEPEDLREVALVLSPGGGVTWDFVRDAAPPA